MKKFPSTKNIKSVSARWVVFPILNTNICTKKEPLTLKYTPQKTIIMDVQFYN